MTGYIEFVALLAVMLFWKRQVIKYYKNHPSIPYSEWPWWVKMNYRMRY